MVVDKSSWRSYVSLSFYLSCNNYHRFLLFLLILHFLCLVLPRLLNYLPSFISPNFSSTFFFTVRLMEQNFIFSFILRFSFLSISFPITFFPQSAFRSLILLFFYILSASILFVILFRNIVPLLTSLSNIAFRVSWQPRISCFLFF